MQRALVVIAATAVLSFATSSLHAQGVCVDDKARQAILACPNGGPKEVDTHARRGVDFHPEKAPSRTASAKLPAPTVTETRDPRKIRLEARERKLLVVELQQVEHLFEATNRNAPDRARIARRLADAYVELESACFRDKTEAEIRRDALKKTNMLAAGQQQAKVDESDRTMKGARKKAIDGYTLLANDYPNDPQLDEVLSYLAYEYEQAGDTKNARATYYDLIKKTPNSKYVPNAYLAFGEQFFNEAQGDPSKWDLAQQAYEEVVKYPAPANKALGYARYKLAYVFWNKGELEKSLDSFKKTIDFGVANPTLPGATRLAESARRDVIPVYAAKGDPKLAYAFLRGLSGDAANAYDKTFTMMDALGNNYIDTGHYPEGIALYRDLLARDKSGRSCGYQAHVTEATMAMKSGDKNVVKGELDNQLKIAESFKTSNYAEADKQTCANRTAALVTETAMAWHLEAVGSSGQRGTNDTKTMALAAYLYKRAADAWSAKEFEGFQFPRLVKDDWPTRPKIQYAMADLFYETKNWTKCGPAFDAVVDDDPKSRDAAEAAYTAGLCYQNLYEETHRDGADRRTAGRIREGESARLAPKTIGPEQAAMIHAFDRYACMIKPAAGDAAGQSRLVEVEYARARTYFEAQHWEEASILFRDIAVRHADRDEGIYAAQLYLESANVLYREFGRTSCEDDMGADTAKFIETYCTAAKNADSCATLKVVQIDLLRAKAEHLVAHGDKEGGRDAATAYERGGQAYFELFRKYCQDPVAAGQKPEAERCDEIAYNAARSFQATRLVAKAITARRALIAFDEKLNLRSPLAKKATYELGGNYQAIAVYDLAAEWYERFARLDAHAENADTALSDAVLLRLGLGQEKEALADARDFAKTYGAAKLEQNAAIHFAIGAHDADKEDWESARLTLTTAMPMIDRASPDVRIQAHAVLGRVYVHLGHPELARAAYAAVRAAWSDPVAAEAKIRSVNAAEDGAQRDKRVGRAVTAVGEALFFAAEERRTAEVEPLKFPEYKGPGDKASVQAHIETKVRAWYTKKRAAIEKVEPEYAKILDLKPVPPPRWVIAAGARAGTMWSDFVDDFRRSPIPKAWKGTELEALYVTKIDLASEPYRADHAKPALKQCLDRSLRYQYFDAFSRSCEVWLAKHYTAEYHVLDELRGAPTLVNNGLEERAPPLLIAGTFWR